MHITHQIYRHLRPSSDHALLTKIRFIGRVTSNLSSSFCPHSAVITPRGFPLEEKKWFKQITECLLGLALSLKVHFRTKLFEHLRAFFIL